VHRIEGAPASDLPLPPTTVELVRRGNIQREERQREEPLKHEPPARPGSQLPHVVRRERGHREAHDRQREKGDGTELALPDETPGLEESAEHEPEDVR
jgi:hypothetical protein